MNTETALRRVRLTLVDALVGRTADPGAPPAAQGLAARVGLTLLAFAATTIIWRAARALGILGTASLYFPATLLVTLFAGWEFGALMLAASGALIWTVAHAGFPPAALAVFAATGVLQLLLAGFVRALLREAWAAERRLQRIAEQRAREADSRELVLGEARHRLKNLMAIIEALAKFSGPRPGAAPSIDAFMHRFVGRLRALGAASDLVLKYGPGVLEAGAVVRAVLEPFLSESSPRFRFDGPELKLSEQFGGALAMAVHELATNALKYGALSVPHGSVSFQWTATPTDRGEQVVFLWKEDGGPAPQPPEKEGYGHRMIRSVAAREMAGEVRIDYRPEGVVCRIAYLRRPSPDSLSA